MRRRTLLASASVLLPGCLGFGTADSSTPTATPPPPTRTEPPTVAPTPASTATATPSRRLDFDPDGPVIDVGEAISAGAREFQVTDWVLKREIRYLDARTETISYATPNGSTARWFQVSGRVTNTGESLVPAPSLDAFRVRHRGGRDAPIYRIDEVGGWGYLREAATDRPIRRPGLDRNTTYIGPDESVGFTVLFVVDSGPELYLEWDAPARHRPVYVRILTDR